MQNCPIVDIRSSRCVAEDRLRTIALTQLGFKEAAEAWLETRRPYLAAKTQHEYKLNIRTLTAFFGECRLSEITADQIRAYQRMRMTQCGPFAINHECSVLQQMLKRIGRWPELVLDYQPLPLPKEKRGRVLADQEKIRLFAAAASSPNWEAAFLFGMISINTTSGPKETASLRLKDIDLERETMRVQPEGAKNDHRTRVIPLNVDALKAIELAIARAKKLGSIEPDHYLFPFRVRTNRYDPTRFQTTFKTAWKKILTKAEITSFRRYDLRHHAMTALLENPKVSEETAESIAGHISREMKKRYSHIRIDRMRQAVLALGNSAARHPRAERKARISSNSTANEELLQQVLVGLANLLKAG